MDYSFIISKSGHPVHNFFKQDIPADFPSKPFNPAISFSRKFPPKAFKVPLPDLGTSRQLIPTASHSKPIEPTIVWNKKTKSVTSKESDRHPDLHLTHLCRKGKLEEAVLALDALAESGSQVKAKTYITLLESCIDSDAIDAGRRIHARVSLVHNSNPFVETKLVSMFAKCGSLKDARNVFDKMQERNLFTWSAMIGGYAREQKWEEVKELFILMVAEGMPPDGFLLPKIVQACANLEEIETGELLHSFAIRTELSSLVHVGNSLLAMYAKCGRLDSAVNVFEKMVEKDRVTWNAMISGYCFSGDHDQAFKLFERMKIEGIDPGLITWNILIGSYNQSGKCHLALELLRKMENSSISPDVFTWTSMISGFSQNKRRNQALDLFCEMLLAGVEPNGVTVASAVSACASLKAFKKGVEIHSIAFKIASATNVLVGNSLIDMYSKCGKLEAAKRVFDEISEKDVFTWNSMIGGYVQAGYCSKAHELFAKMEDYGTPQNVVTWNVMISGYIQNGDEDQAMDLFHKMEKMGIKRSTATWNSLIAGSLQNGNANKSLGLFRQMQSFSMRPNSVTILSLLPACANLVAGSKVKEIHSYVIRTALDAEISVANSLIDAYAKSGDMVRARFVFNTLSSRDLISWNSLLAGYVLHGQSDIVIDLSNRMMDDGIKPNLKTFASLILAYGFAKMVSEGKKLFMRMTEDSQVSPGIEHYTAMVELFGRSGKLTEATDFVEKVPMEPNSSVWAALLTASKVHNNIELAVHAAEHLIKLEPGRHLLHEMLVQMYDLVGRTNDASRVSKPKKRNRAMSSVGSSWIEVNNMVHTFFSGDQSMSNSDAISSLLDSVEEKLLTLGPNSPNLQLQLKEEENSGIHSEKLAMAFALISSPTFRCIRIIKNLRMCESCHNTAKAISLLYGREIILKDPECLHYFKDGQCSCRDYW